jgi:hypothetical protein
MQHPMIFRGGIDPPQLYVTITALSRFHLANAYSFSAVLDLDMQSPDWRARWADHAADVVRRYVAADGGTGPIVRPPAIV